MDPVLNLIRQSLMISISPEVGLRFILIPAPLVPVALRGMNGRLRHR